MSLDHAHVPPYLLRPALPTDLEALERLARASAIGISSLPPDRAALQDKLERSTRSFASEDEAVSGEELYLFVLEDRTRDGLLIGTCGIEAQPGFQDRFYSYRNEFIVQVSPELGTRNRTHTLHLCHDLTGVTLLTGFHIDAAYEQSLAPQLLSRARLLFISHYQARFSDHIAAENPGPSDESGRCPFWDAVGRRFFNMDYPSAEALNSGRNKSYIAELMPQSPIYVPLLDEPAQWALGQLHEVGELPFSILLDEGFDADTYINIFDGGPTVEGRLASLKTVRHARMASAQAWPEPGQERPALRWQLACHAAPLCRDFRAALLPAAQGRPYVSEAAAGVLGMPPGARLLVAELDVQGGPA